MKEDKKGMAALIVSKMGASKSPESEGEGADYDGKMACAEDMMAAVEQKDAKAFMAALDSYLDHR